MHELFEYPMLLIETEGWYRIINNKICDHCVFLNVLDIY